MRILVGGAAAAAFALGSMTVAPAAQCTMPGMMMSHPMPHCTAASGPVVWFMASAKRYYLKGSAHYGTGAGAYVCRATAVKRGGKPGPMPLPPTQTMRPRPMSSMPGSMPSAATPGPGLPNSTNAAPGSVGSPRPTSSGNPTSGNQGNTGAPGAGGQVPNNPASSSNSNPNPSPSPHP